MHALSILAQTTQHNPLIPKTFDIVWSVVCVVIITVLFWKYVLPRFHTVLAQRAEKIKGGIERAEQIQAGAQEALARYTAGLSHARGGSGADPGAGPHPRGADHRGAAPHRGAGTGPDHRGREQPTAGAACADPDGAARRTRRYPHGFGRAGAGRVPVRRWHAFGHGRRFSRRADGAAHNAMSEPGPSAGTQVNATRRPAPLGGKPVWSAPGSMPEAARGAPGASGHPAGDRHRNQHHAQRQQNPDSQHDVLLSSGARRMCFVFPAWTGTAVGSLKGNRVPGSAEEHRGPARAAAQKCA